MVHIREKIYPELVRRGGGAAVILPQKRAKVKEYLSSHPHPFPVLVDEKRQVVKEYGVYVRVNFESLHIARPSVFVLDGEGNVRYVFIASVQTEYPPDQEILAALDRSE